MVDNFTYTLESVIEAGKARGRGRRVVIPTNRRRWESRLFDSTSACVRRNGMAILRIYTRYEPLRVFVALAARHRSRTGRRWMPFLVDWIFNRRPQRPPPVADPRRGALRWSRPDLRPGHHRRHARRSTGDRRSASSSECGGSSSSSGSSRRTTSLPPTAPRTSTNGTAQTGSATADHPARRRASWPSASG